MIVKSSGGDSGDGGMSDEDEDEKKSVDAEEMKEIGAAVIMPAEPKAVHLG